MDTLHSKIPVLTSKFVEIAYVITQLMIIRFVHFGKEYYTDSTAVNYTIGPLFRNFTANPFDPYRGLSEFGCQSIIFSQYFLVSTRANLNFAFVCSRIGIYNFRHKTAMNKPHVVFTIVLAIFFAILTTVPVIRFNRSWSSYNVTFCDISPEWPAYMTKIVNLHIIVFCDGLLPFLMSALITISFARKNRSLLLTSQCILFATTADNTASELLKSANHKIIFLHNHLPIVCFDGIVISLFRSIVGALKLILVISFMLSNGSRIDYHQLVLRKLTIENVATIIDVILVAFSVVAWCKSSPQLRAIFWQSVFGSRFLRNVAAIRSPINQGVMPQKTPATIVMEMDSDTLPKSLDQLLTVRNRQLARYLHTLYRRKS